MDLAKLNKWHQTNKGHLVFGLVELALVYAFASWAINSGSLWQYALAIIFLVFAYKSFVALGRRILHR